MKFRCGMIVLALAVWMIGCWPQRLHFGSPYDIDYRLPGWSVEMYATKYVDNSKADTLSGYFLRVSAISQKKANAGILIIDSLTIFGTDHSRITPKIWTGYEFGTVPKSGSGPKVYADFDLGDSRPDTLIIRIYYDSYARLGESAKKFSFEYHLPFGRMKTWYGGR